MPRIEDIGAFNAVREAGLARLVPAVPRIAVGMGTCGRGNGAEGLYHAFVEVLDRSGTSTSISPMLAASEPAARSRWSTCACPDIRS